MANFGNGDRVKDRRGQTATVVDERPDRFGQILVKADHDSRRYRMLPERLHPSSRS